MKLYILNCSEEQVANAARQLRGAHDPLAFFEIKRAYTNTGGYDYASPRILQATKRGASAELYANQLQDRLQEISRDIVVTTFQPPKDY